MAKILIVDDEKGICDEFRDILMDDDHEVDTVTNGADGLIKVRENRYDLVFLDVLMPRMEGREVLEKMKVICKVPVAIMSGYIPPNKEQEIIALGAVACLKKPLDLRKVRELIASLERKSEQA